MDLKVLKLNLDAYSLAIVFAGMSKHDEATEPTSTLDGTRDESSLKSSGKNRKLDSSDPDHEHLMLP